MQDDLHIEDGGGDRKYFTIIPNFVLNHSSHWDREVYIQMKRIAGEHGRCWTSRNTLAKQCGISVRKLDECLKYLMEHEWIRRIGTRKVSGMKGGVQEVYEYQIVDLWRKNISFYEGGAGGALPSGKGGAGGAYQGGAGGAYKEEPNTKEDNTNEPPAREDDSSGKDEIQGRLDTAREIDRLGRSRKKAERIVAWYWRRKGFDFENHVQMAQQFGRDMKAASLMAKADYTVDSVEEVAKYCDKNYERWTLETIGKVYHEVV